MRKHVLIFLIALLSSYSFSNLYSNYQDKSFVEELSKNNINHTIDYNLTETISVDMVLNSYGEIARDEGFVLYSFSYNGIEKRIKYYNPSKNKEFNNLIEDYENKCTINCITFKAVEVTEFNIGTSNIQFFSLSDIDDTVFEKYDLDVIYNDEYIDAEHQIEEESIAKKIITEYYLYIIINILICITLVFILFISLISNIREITLHAIYGFKFKTLFFDFNKKYLKSYLVIYFITFNILALIIYRNISIILVSILYTLLQILLIYTVFVIIQFSFYNNIKKNYQYKHIRKSIVILSIIISFFTVLTVQFMDSSIKYTKSYINVSESFEVSKNYYTLDHDMSMDLKTQANISNSLIDDYNAIYRVLIDEDYYILEVEESFFEDNDIKDSDGNEIISSPNYAYIVNNQILNGKSTFDWGYTSRELVYIKDTGQDYVTLDYKTPTVKLKEVIIIVKDSDELLMSNVSLYSDSEEEAEKIFKEAYMKNNIKYEPSFHVVGNSFFTEEYREKSISSILSAIIAFITILISNISYAYLIFENNKDRIILSNIYGQNYFNRMSSMLKESAIVVLITLTMMMVIGVYAALIYTIILIVQFIVLNIITNRLVGKLLISNMKEEM